MWYHVSRKGDKTSPMKERRPVSMGVPTYFFAIQRRLKATIWANLMGGVFR